MTRADRLELTRIIRQRAKLARDDVAAREAAIIADAEAALSKVFKREDEAWRDVVAEADRLAEEANAKVQAICEERGVPEEFRPVLSRPRWYGRGENQFASRRAELRAKVRTRAAALGKQAKLEIDRQSVALQERVMVGGLESSEAREFLSSIPSPEALMPALEIRELETEAGSG